MFSQIPGVFVVLREQIYPGAAFTPEEGGEFRRGRFDIFQGRYQGLWLVDLFRSHHICIFNSSTLKKILFALLDLFGEKSKPSDGLESILLREKEIRN